MRILRKIWNWFFEKKEVEKWEKYKARKLKEVDVLSKEVQGVKKEISKYATGGYIKNAERYVAPRYSETISSNSNDNYRNNNDNFLTGAMVGYVVADSLDDNSHKAVEETKSSSYESSYTPSSSSSYDSGSYSSSYDSGSSSFSCDSGGC